ncbi:MAG: hypothetical protein H6Q36_696 [Chloroflexi bacterium]|nr:hypothetical protein [Chloroflexota bacterium]
MSAGGTTVLDGASGPDGAATPDAAHPADASATPGGDRPLVLVLAADPAWAARLAAQLRVAGAEAEVVADPAVLSLRLAAGAADAGVVDMTALSYDGLEVAADAASTGPSVLAVIARDNARLRERAKAAGIPRVATYRAMFLRGPRILADWLGLPQPSRGAGARALAAATAAPAATAATPTLPGSRAVTHRPTTEPKP